MIYLKSLNDAIKRKSEIPELALLRMQQLEDSGGYDPESHGFVIVAQSVDTLESIPECGIDPLIEYVRFVRQDNHRIFEIVIAHNDDKMIAIICNEETTMTDKLRRYLDDVAEEEIITN